MDRAPRRRHARRVRRRQARARRSSAAPIAISMAARRVGSSCRRLAVVSTLSRSARTSRRPHGTLGRYHILRELGRGSMGIVLRAYDPELARPVAIKLLRGVDAELIAAPRGERAREAAARQRRQRSTTSSSRADTLYVAMELVDGDTLRAYCKGRPTREVLAACIARRARARCRARCRRRFIATSSPRTSCAGPDGEARVSDFGLARTADEMRDGTLARHARVHGAGGPRARARDRRRAISTAFASACTSCSKASGPVGATRACVRAGAALDLARAAARSRA